MSTVGRVAACRILVGNPDITDRCQVGLHRVTEDENGAGDREGSPHSPQLALIEIIFSH